MPSLGLGIPDVEVIWHHFEMPLNSTTPQIPRVTPCLVQMGPLQVILGHTCKVGCQLIQVQITTVTPLPVLQMERASVRVPCSRVRPVATLIQMGQMEPVPLLPEEITTVFRAFSKSRSFDSKAGFTLIELLVATAILVLLSTVVIVSFRSANRTSRDSKRKSDLQQVRGILETYRLENGTYPNSQNPNQVVSGATGLMLSLDLSSFTGSEFVDPQNTGTQVYRYVYRNLPGCTYELGVVMENESNLQSCSACYPSGSPPEGPYYCVSN